MGAMTRWPRGEQRGQGAGGRSGNGGLGLTVLAHAAGATIAGSGPALLLSAGVTLLAEGAVVAHRAFTSGGRQWQARGTGQQAAWH